jgi:hypothetical protein
MVAAPWKTPPVLQPTGLVADSSAVSTVTFRWSGPATGPAPDRYEIVRDGQRVGYVPGNITFYRDTGLAPASAYRYQVIAIRDGRLSRRSPVLSLDTVTPPVSDAVLDSTWAAHYTVTSTNFSSIFARSWSDTWTFTPVCGTDLCNVTLDGKWDKSAFTATLARTGAVYTGTARLDNWASCQGSNKYVPGVIKIRIQVQDAGVDGTTWAASAWSGTATLNTVETACAAAGTVKTNVDSSRSLP